MTKLDLIRQRARRPHKHWPDDMEYVLSLLDECYEFFIEAPSELESDYMNNWASELAGKLSKK